MTPPILLRRLACAALLLVAGDAAGAQSNAIPGLDVRLGELGPIQALGRRAEGGVNGIAFLTTACNVGTVTVPWIDGDSTVPMGDDHPWIAFLVARYDGQRLVQISDRSYVKHGFFAQSNSNCTPCTPPPGPTGTFLGVGCSDTYGTSSNGDNFWLGLYGPSLQTELSAQVAGLKEQRSPLLLPFAERFAEIVDGRFSFTVGVSARVAKPLRVGPGAAAMTSTPSGDSSTRNPSASD